MPWEEIVPDLIRRQTTNGLWIGVQCLKKQTIVVFNYRDDVAAALRVKAGDRVKFYRDKRRVMIRKSTEAGYAVVRPTKGNFLRSSMSVKHWPGAMIEGRAPVSIPWRAEEGGVVISVPDFLDARFDTDAVVTRSARRRAMEGAEHVAA